MAESALDRADRAFAEAAADGSLPRLRADLFALSELLAAQPRVRRVLADIGVPAEGKAAFLRDLLADRIDGRALSLLESFVAEDSLSWRIPAVVREVALRAVLAEAEADRTLAEVEDELFRFARLLESEGRLRSAFSNPVLPDENKRALLDDLVGGRVHAATALLLRDAVLREGDPLERIQALAERAAARRDRLVVEARTAIDLDDERRDRLAAGLSRATGRRVDVEVVVDPTVVGGVLARVGDEVIDGSVRRQLQLALERLGS